MADAASGGKGCGAGTGAASDTIGWGGGSETIWAGSTGGVGDGAASDGTGSGGGSEAACAGSAGGAGGAVAAGSRSIITAASAGAGGGHVVAGSRIAIQIPLANRLVIIAEQIAQRSFARPRSRRSSDASAIARPYLA